jgi:hypothetical protein
MDKRRKKEEEEKEKKVAETTDSPLRHQPIHPQPRGCVHLQRGQSVDVDAKTEKVRSSTAHVLRPH